MLQNNVIYSFVREDLSTPQRAVQLGHALYLVGKNFPHYDDSPFLIVFGCKTEKSLKNTLDNLREQGIMVVEFREPDLNNELTAVATAVMPRTDENRKIFRKYQLLKE